jgi:hypothetical protein
MNAYNNSLVLAPKSQLLAPERIGYGAVVGGGDASEPISPSSLNHG